MKLSTLKQKLSVVTGTSIKQVDFDLTKFLSNDRVEILYPAIVWNFNNATFQRDFRTSTIQVVKPITVTMFIVTGFDPLTESGDQKITKWDNLETYLGIYLTAMNNTAALEVANINNLKGEYIPEGVLESRKEIGIMVQGVILKTSCLS